MIQLKMVGLMEDQKDTPRWGNGIVTYRYPNFSSLNLSQHAHSMAAIATVKCV